MYGEWYGVCDFVVLSRNVSTMVVRMCFVIVLIFFVVYGVGVCVNVCGVVCGVICFLRLCVCCVMM